MRLLLDYPWDLDAARGSDPVPQKAIQDFLDLLSRTGLDPVPFIDHQACEDLFNNIQQHKSGRNFHQLLSRFLNQCIRDVGSTCRAAPDPGPMDLRDSWKSALREELGNHANWRNPHIVVPESRLTEWEPHENEIAIRCEECDDQPASGPHHRVLAVLERYELHPFAVPDIDPWCHLEWLYPPDIANKQPCRLPRPPILDRIPIEELVGSLTNVRRDGWEINGRYYFIPPDNWRPEQITKAKWRAGYAFDREKVVGWKGPCPIDYNGVTWRWDRGERHWDVQTEPYISVSHTGELLS
jgi:hypothetical protein